MTSTLLTRPPTLFDTVGVPEAGAGGVGGEPTLDDLVIGLWEGLATHRPVRCPLCDGELRAVPTAHARPVGGRCHDCGTTLS